MKHAPSALLALGLAVFAANGAAASPAAPTLTFGIVPQQSASRLAKMWAPLLNALTERTGAVVQFRTTKDIPTFEACLAANAFDIAYMNPMHYAIFSEESGYRAIARQANKKLKGIIVAKAGSKVGDFAPMDGQDIAFPAPGAFGASILTRSALSKQGVSFDPKYVKSHDSVYRAVAAGLMPAGGGVTRTFNAASEAIRSQLQIVHETDGYTPHAIAVSAKISADRKTEIQAALMQIAREEPALVKRIGMSGFETGADQDWDDVRALGMARDETGISHAGDIACPSG